MSSPLTATLDATPTDRSARTAAGPPAPRADEQDAPRRPHGAPRALGLDVRDPQRGGRLVPRGPRRRAGASVGRAPAQPCLPCAPPRALRGLAEADAVWCRAASRRARSRRSGRSGCGFVPGAGAGCGASLRCCVGRVVAERRVPGRAPRRSTSGPTPTRLWTTSPSSSSMQRPLRRPSLLLYPQ